MKPLFPIGISSYALRWSIQWKHVSAESALETAARAGAQVVQICENLAPHERPERELRGLSALADQHGLALELGAVGCTPDHLLTCLQTASYLNARILRIVLCGANPFALPELESTIRASLPELHKRGICLAIENHFDLAPRDLKLLVEAIGSPQIGICLDVFNSVYHLASQAETIAWLAPLAKTVRVKDVNIRRQNTGFYLHGCRLGEGRFDLEGLLSA